MKKSYFALFLLASLLPAFSYAHQENLASVSRTITGNYYSKGRRIKSKRRRGKRKSASVSLGEEKGRLELYTALGCWATPSVGTILDLSVLYGGGVVGLKSSLFKEYPVLSLAGQLGFLIGKGTEKGSFSFNTYALTLGGTLFWRFTPGYASFIAELGLQNSIDFLWSRVALGDNSFSAGSSLRYRVGPEVSLGLRVSPQLTGRINASLTTTPFGADRPFFWGFLLGISLGL